MTEEKIVHAEQVKKVKQKQRQEERREWFDAILEVIFEGIASLLESIFS